MNPTASERQATFIKKRQRLGWLRSIVWIPGPVVTELKERYPGPRGGVDWVQVAYAALRKRTTTTDKKGQPHE